MCHVHDHVQVYHPLAESPSVGRHLAFDGRLLHGAPTGLSLAPRGRGEGRGEGSGEGRRRDAAAVSGTGRSRVTFLVNVWLNRKPWAAEPLPRSVAATLSRRAMHLLGQDSKAAEGRPAEGQGAEAASTAVLDVPLSGQGPHTVKRWRFGKASERLELQMAWPAQPFAPLSSASPSPADAAPPLIRLRFGRDAACALRALPAAADVPGGQRGKAQRKRGKRASATPRSLRGSIGGSRHLPLNAATARAI